MAFRNGKPDIRVLLVEDSQDDVILVVRAIQAEYHAAWHRVETESNLILALEDDWDVIICDYVLPRFDARAALEIVQETLEARNRFIPFIVVSGRVDEKIAVELLKKGARDFISKDKMERLPLAIQREMRQSGELLNAHLRIEESYDGVIEAWGKALELRDHYTKGHTERVTNLALRLAVFLSLSHEDFINVNRGALLHDIGKMGIPDAILLKQDALSFEEMEIMKMHTTLALQMLQNIPFLKSAAVIPYCHHERWNGKGYPQGLMGAKIPFIARLFAVVDVYDALTSDRPYRPSWEKSKAIAYILDERGISFDPEIVDAFVDMTGRA